jgi:hypothetical protein
LAGVGFGGQTVNAGFMKAGDICRNVEPIVKEVVGSHAKFTASSHHVAACRFYKIRPSKGQDRTKTNIKYCHYDAAHNDYVYTEEWKAFLIDEMQKPGKYQEILDEYRKISKEYVRRKKTEINES